MIIDCHTHIFPDRIAPRVMEVNEKNLGLKAYGTGTKDGILSYMDEAGVDYAVVLGVAPAARLVKSTNDWLLALVHPRLIIFGTVTPDYENWQEEIHRLKVNGARGIKINSLLQDIVPDDPVMYPIYEKLIKEDMAILLHSGKGEGRNSKAPLRSTPKQLRKVHDDFPKLRMIIAHFGGYSMLNDVRQYLVGQEVYFDTSYCPTIKEMDPKEVCALIRAHGVDRMLYGTDYPWAKQGITEGWEYDFIRNLPLTPKEKEMILGENAFALFKP
jgi:predicted TIM-barrel fold metal-dependent hydrolase